MALRIILAPLFVLLLFGQVQAHTLYFTLNGGDDNTVELEGLFSNGQTAAGVTVRLYDKQAKRVIWQGKTDEFGSCVFNRPGIPYEVELDAGPGHQTRQEGI